MPPMQTIDLAYVGRGLHEELVAYVADQEGYFEDEGVHVAVRDGIRWKTERLRGGATIGLGRTLLSRLTDGIPWNMLAVNTSRPRGSPSAPFQRRDGFQFGACRQGIAPSHGDYRSALRLLRRRLARLQNGQQSADFHMALQRVSQVQPPFEPVVVLAPHALALDVAPSFQIDHDPLDGPFGNSHHGRNVSNADFGPDRDAIEHVRMVAQERPYRIVLLLGHFPDPQARPSSGLVPRQSRVRNMNSRKPCHESISTDRGRQTAR
jgi:hypothetical protein